MGDILVGEWPEYEEKVNCHYFREELQCKSSRVKQGENFAKKDSTPLSLQRINEIANGREGFAVICQEKNKIRAGSQQVGGGVGLVDGKEKKVRLIGKQKE